MRGQGLGHQRKRDTCPQVGSTRASHIEGVQEQDKTRGNEVWEIRSALCNIVLRLSLVVVVSIGRKPPALSEGWRNFHLHCQLIHGIH